MSLNTFKLKEINFPKGWIISKNDFVDLEPDNDFPVENITLFFIEDILQANFNEFTLDLGFYGDYTIERSGFFRLLLIKGDFINGEIIDSLMSRSTNEIQSKINFFFNYISDLQSHTQLK